MSKPKPEKPDPTNSEPSNPEDTEVTVPIDQTIEIEPSKDKTVRIDQTVDIDKTVAIDQTVSMDDDPPSASDTPTVRVGKTGKIEKSPEETTVSTIDSINQMTVASGESVMNSDNIGQTINPRELNAQETLLWDSIANSDSTQPEPTPSAEAVSQNKSSTAKSSDADFSHGSGATGSSPAIERTFSEKHLARLRQCNLAKSIDDPQVRSDYRLKRKLGAGGMGDVYVAEQRSLDRQLALKVIKPLDEKKRQQLIRKGRLQEVEDDRRMQFLAEAIITGDLDHPNIVPIHDVALTPENELFYSMKRVVGTPWSDVIAEKTRDENLEILLRVCDAIGFAHTRGVVHRDIKPENVMLGDFGVVMVMDWGLALPTDQYDVAKQESILATSGLGGTPAFMAPEMATGPLRKIGATSDIYLLGATLYMIITGHAPHKARNVTECLLAVRNNKIIEAEPHHQGELLEIAIKAMATRPEDRFTSVVELQEAIRDFRRHDQSINQTSAALEHLREGKRTLDYNEFNRARFGFEEAIRGWNGNQRAKDALAATTIAHAEAAYQNGDFGQGLSLLDPSDPDHAEMHQRLTLALDERESRKRNLTRAKYVGAAMLAFILVGGTMASYRIQQEKNVAVNALELAEQRGQEAIEQRDEADRQRDEADMQREIAEKQTVVAEQKTELAEMEERKAKAATEVAMKAKAAEEDAREKAQTSEQKAIAEKKIANLARDAEFKQRRNAERERQSAQYEAYVSRIGLAKTALETNDGQNARETLERLREDSPQVNGWEWRYLWQQANESLADARADAAIIDLDVSPDGRRGIIAKDDGGVELVQFQNAGRLIRRAAVPKTVLGIDRATCVAISSDASTFAVGTASGRIVTLGPTGNQSFDDAHADVVSDLVFADNDTLVSGSRDRTVRVFDLASGDESTAQRAIWHVSPVRQIAVSRSESSSQTSFRLVVATADQRSGRVAVWNIRNDGDFDFESLGTMTDHPAPVVALTINREGTRAASGDTAGNVWVWDPRLVDSIDYGDAIKRAISRSDPERKTQLSAPEQRNDPLEILKLVDDQNASAGRLVSTTGSSSPPVSAHTDVINAIAFAADGQTLVTASDDYLLKIWDTKSGTLRSALRGHGGWVVGATFLGGNSDLVVSASGDQTLRTWKPSTYHGSFVSQKVPHSGSQMASGASERISSPHDQSISSARFSPDGTRVVTASRDHTAVVMSIDPETLAFVDPIELRDEASGHPNARGDDKLAEGSSFLAMSMETDRSAKRLFIGSADAVVRFWDVSKGIQLGEVTGTGFNNTIAVSADGGLLLTGSSSPKVKANLWRIAPGLSGKTERVHGLDGHQEAVTALAISPDGKTLFTGDRGGYGILWDAVTGRAIGEPIQDVRGFRINEARFSSDGRTLWLGADDEQLTVIDVASRRRIGRLNHDGFVTKFSLSADGRHAVTISELVTETSLTSTATFWNLSTRTPTVLDRVKQAIANAEQRVSRSRLCSVRFDSSGNTIAVTRSADSNRGIRDQAARIQIWDVKKIQKGSKPESEFALPTALRTAEVVIPLGPESVLSMNQNGAFRWNLDDGRLTKSYRSHAALTEAAFSHDGNYVVTASRSIKIWDAATGRALAKLETPHEGPVRSVAMSPTHDRELGQRVYAMATAGDDGQVRLWNWDATSETIKPVASFALPNRQPIGRVRFAPSGKRLIAVGDRGTARVWTIGKDKPDWTVSSADHGDFISVAWTPDENHAVIGGTDHRIRIWKIEPRLPADAAPLLTLEGHGGDVHDVTTIGKTAADLRIVSASADDSMKVWDPRLGVRDAKDRQVSGREILSLRRHTGDVTSVDSIDQGRLLMTAGSDANVILYPATSATDPPIDPPIKDTIDLFDSLDLP